MRAARRRALAIAVALATLAALLIPLLAGRATSATSLAYVFNGSQGLRASAVLSSRYNNWPSNASLLGVVPIVITNTQNTPTQAPFDELLNLTAGELGILWDELYPDHFLNMLFVNSSNKPLYAWVMNYTPGWVDVWVKLPNGVPARSSITIYLEVTNRTEYPYTGIYSALYKGYDNGNYLFPLYSYFNNTVPSGWTTGVYTGIFKPKSTVNGLEMMNNTGNAGTYAYTLLPNINGNYSVLASWWYNGSFTAPRQAIYKSITWLARSPFKLTMAEQKNLTGGSYNEVLVVEVNGSLGLPVPGGLTVTVNNYPSAGSSSTVTEVISPIMSSFYNYSLATLSAGSVKVNMGISYTPLFSIQYLTNKLAWVLQQPQGGSCGSIQGYFVYPNGTEFVVQQITLNQTVKVESLVVFGSGPSNVVTGNITISTSPVPTNSSGYVWVSGFGEPWWCGPHSWATPIKFTPNVVLKPGTYYVILHMPTNPWQTLCTYMPGEPKALLYNGQNYVEQYNCTMNLQLITNVSAESVNTGANISTSLLIVQNSSTLPWRQIQSPNSFYVNSYVNNPFGIFSLSFVGGGTSYLVTYVAVANNSAEYWGYTTVGFPYELVMPGSFANVSLNVNRSGSRVSIAAVTGNTPSYIYLDAVLVFPTPPNNAMPSFTVVTSQSRIYLPRGIALVNSVESTLWTVPPYLRVGQLVINASPTPLTVPIVINNTQASPTPAPFDQFINITKQQVESVLGIVGLRAWSQAESQDFLNVLFVNSSGKPLYAWVQSFTPNWVVVWVRLPNGVPAHGTVNITMEFTNASQYPYTGLAPYLTSTYGQYDNGQYVFPVYYNFAGTSLPQGLTFTVLSNPKGASGLYKVSNSLNITNINGTDFWGNYFMISLVYINKTFNFTATPLLFEAIVKGIGGSIQYWSKAGLVYMNSINDSSTSNGEVAPLAGGVEYAIEWQSGTSYIAPSQAWTGGSVSFPTVIAMFLNKSYVIGFYGSSLLNLVQMTSAVTPSGYKGVGYVGLFDTSHSSNAFWAIFELLLARPWPPNGVMPTAEVVWAGHPVGQYIAWAYAPAGSALNITVQVKGYPSGINGAPGVVLYSVGMGDLQSDDLMTYFEGLLISFNGSVFFHPLNSLYVTLKVNAFPEPKAPFTMTVILTEGMNGNTIVSYVYINGTAYAVNLNTPMPWAGIGYVGLRASPDNLFYVSYFGASPSLLGGVEDFINGVESTSWKVLPYWWNSELVINSTGASVAGQYIAWQYSPVSNTINITVHVPSFPVQASGKNLGLEVLSPNVGDQTSDGNSGFYVLLVDFYGGSIWFHSPTSGWEQLYSSLPQPNSSHPFTFTVILTESPSTGDAVVSMIYINNTAYAINVNTPYPWSQIGYVGIRGDIGSVFYVSYFGVSPVYLGPYIATSRLYLTPASSMTWGAVAWQANYNGNSNLTVSLVGTFTLGSSPPGDLDIGLFLTPMGWGVNPQSNFSVPVAPVSLSTLGAAPALMSSTNYLLVEWSPYLAYEGLSYDVRAALIYFNSTASRGVIKYYNGSAKVGVPSSGNLINFTVTYVPASGKLVVLVKNLNTGASEKDVFSVGFKAGAGAYAFFVGAGNGLDYANWQILNITVAGASVIASESTSTVTVVTTFTTTVIPAIVLKTYTLSSTFTTTTTISSSTTAKAIVTETIITTSLTSSITTIVGTTTKVNRTTSLMTAPNITSSTYKVNGWQIPTVGTSVTYVTANSTSSPLTVVFSGAYANVTPSAITERSFSVNYTTVTPYGTALTYVFNSTKVTVITNVTTVIHNTTSYYSMTLYSPITYIDVTGVSTVINSTATQSFYVTQYETSYAMITSYQRATVVESVNSSSLSRTTTTSSTTITNGASLASITSYGTISTKFSSTATQVITNSTASTSSGAEVVSITTTVTSMTSKGKTVSAAILTATTMTISYTFTAVTTSPTTVTFNVNYTGVTLIYTVTEKTIINGTVYANVTVTTKYVTYSVTAVTVYENITTILPTYGVFANGYGFYIMIQTPAPVRYLSYMVYAYFANYSQMVVIASPLYSAVTGNYTLVVGYNLTSGVQHILLSTVLSNQTLSTTITVNATPTVYFGQQRFDPILWVVTPPAQLPSLNSGYLIDATILFVAAVAGAFMFHSNRRDAALGLVAFALFATFILSLSSAPLFAYASLVAFLAVIGAIIMVVVERNREA